MWDKFFSVLNELKNDKTHNYLPFSAVSRSFTGRTSPRGGGRNADRVESRAKPVREGHEEEDQARGVEKRGDADGEKGGEDGEFLQVLPKPRHV